MRTRSKKIISDAEPAEGLARSQRLRQSAPTKAPRTSKTRTVQPATPAGQPASSSESVTVLQEVVHFELAAPAAREVFLAGTFNDWKYGATPMARADGGKWVADLTLHPGVYEYRFVVDGEWRLDPNNMESVPNPFGEANSLLILGPFSHPNQKQCQ